MLFTRQPIVETIITPKEGCQLQLKHSNQSSSESYFANALELVIYGTTPFYRSLEGSRPFLVPAAQFDVEQVKEARISLKHAVYDRKVGRESSSREPKKNMPPRERPTNSKEDKSEITSSSSENWERRKYSRKRASGSSSVESTAKLPKSTPNNESQSRDTTTPNLEIYEAFNYDLVPPPQTFVAESIENLQKTREISQELPAREQQSISTAHDPLETVDAILKSDFELDQPNDPPIG